MAYFLKEWPFFLFTFNLAQSLHRPQFTQQDLIWAPWRQRFQDPEAGLGPRRSKNRPKLGCREPKVYKSVEAPVEPDAATEPRTKKRYRGRSTLSKNQRKRAKQRAQAAEHLQRDGDSQCRGGPFGGHAMCARGYRSAQRQFISSIITSTFSNLCCA